MFLIQNQEPRNVFEEISGGFRSHFVDQPIFWLLALIFVFILAYMVLKIVSSSMHTSARSRKTRTLFRRLCLDNELTRSEIRLLKKMALVYEISDPVYLFLRRTLFEKSSAAIDLDSSTKEQLIQKLFVV